MRIESRIRELEIRAKAKGSMFYVVTSRENDVFVLGDRVMNSSEFAEWERSLSQDDIVFVISRLDDSEN